MPIGRRNAIQNISQRFMMDDVSQHMPEQVSARCVCARLSPRLSGYSLRIHVPCLLPSYLSRWILFAMLNFKMQLNMVHFGVGNMG